MTCYRFEQLRGIVSGAVLEDDLDVLDVVDANARVALDDQEIGVLRHGDGADLVLPAEIGCAVQGPYPDRLPPPEAYPDQPLVFSVLGEARAYYTGTRQN